MVLVVCNNRETPSSAKFCKGYRPDAFITAGSVMGIYGREFQPIKH